MVYELIVTIKILIILIIFINFLYFQIINGLIKPLANI